MKRDVDFEVNQRDEERLDRYLSGILKCIEARVACREYSDWSEGPKEFQKVRNAFSRWRKTCLDPVYHYRGYDAALSEIDTVDFLKLCSNMGRENIFKGNCCGVDAGYQYEWQVLVGLINRPETRVFDPQQLVNDIEATKERFRTDPDLEPFIDPLRDRLKASTRFEVRYKERPAEFVKERLDWANLCLLHINAKIEENRINIKPNMFHHDPPEYEPPDRVRKFRRKLQNLMEIRLVAGTNCPTTWDSFLCDLDSLEKEAILLLGADWAGS